MAQRPVKPARLKSQIVTPELTHSHHVCTTGGFTIPVPRL